MEEFKTTRQRLLDELEGDYDATFDEIMNSGLCFGNTKEEMDGTKFVVCDLMWEAEHARNEGDYTRYYSLCARIEDLIWRGMEAHYVARNKSS